jgi:hypothetical protein
VPYIEELPLGYTRFVDAGVGYSIVAPPDWILIDLTGQDREQTVTALWNAYPEISDVFEYAARRPKGFDQRTAAVDLDRDHWAIDAAPTFDLGISTTPDGRSLEEILSAFSETLIEKYPEGTLVDARLSETQTGIPVAVVDFEYPTLDIAGEPTTFRMRKVYFHVRERLAVLTITEPFGHMPTSRQPVIHLDSVELLPDG